MNINKDEIQKLIESAFSARENSYSPYSRFAVGAALMTEYGKIYSAANVENASYPVGICAERVVVSYAVSGGERTFKAMAVVGGRQDTYPLTDYCTPCGMCRQFLSEFCGKDFIIISAKSKTDYRIFTLEEMLPYSFDGDFLN